MKRTVELEQYYTSREVASASVNLVKRHFPLEYFELVVEPSAGEGSFFELLPPTSRVGLDLEPRASEIQQYDYLKWSPPSVDGPVLTIGNPPFGQRAAKAINFLDKAASYSDVIALILPRSFKKYTFQNRIPKLFHLVDELDCDEFYGYGRDHTIKTVFQIWEKRTSPRALVKPPANHADFEMRHCHLSRVKPGELEVLRSEYQFAIPQVGIQFRPKSSHEVTKGSYWFIKPLISGVRERFESLDFSFLDGMNTAHKSLSKRDIVTAYQAATDMAGVDMSQAGASSTQLSFDLPD